MIKLSGQGSGFRVQGSEKNRSLSPVPCTLKRGFTLVELMLVVIIIGTLVAMVMPRLAGRTEQAKRAAAKADIEANIASALDLYEIDSGSYPDNLDALLEKRDGKGPYLKKPPIDPWGHQYNYAFPGAHSDYDLWSNSKDGVNNNGEGDDVANWQTITKGGEPQQ